MDSGPFVRRDGGPREPTVDGVITEGEWRNGTVAENTVETDRVGSALTRLRAALSNDALVVAVEGTLAEGDALVVYVDRALGEADGVDLGALADEDGALDVALSSPAGAPLVGPTGFRVDAALGTTEMPRSAVGLDEATGWRDVGTDASNFAWLPGEEGLLVCSDTVCEGSLPLEALGGEAPRTIALFARIVRADGALTNQTLPEDDADAPATVSAVLTLDEGAIVVDAGTPDAGPPDAGPPDGVVIDGVLGVEEWASASVFTNTAAPAGTFATNPPLTRLFTMRDATHLYMAVEGGVSAGNAIVAYLDRDVGDGTGVPSPTPLDDFNGDLDRALSKMLFTPSDLWIDFAWGTLDMGRVGALNDPRMGWRDVSSNLSLFAPVSSTVAPTACGPTTCETSISLAALGAGSGDDIGVFVRLVSATSLAMSNQTLPMDDPLAPELVSVYALVRP